MAASVGVATLALLTVLDVSGASAAPNAQIAPVDTIAARLRRPTRTPTPTRSPTPWPVSPTPTATPVINPTGGAHVAGCPTFPANNIWNTRVDQLPVQPMSGSYLASIGNSVGLHPDFGTVWNGAPNGIPFVSVPGSQQRVNVSFTYADESDPGPNSAEAR